jgi:hypothetical protein
LLLNADMVRRLLMAAREVSDVPDEEDSLSSRFLRQIRLCCQVRRCGEMPGRRLN